MKLNTKRYIYIYINITTLCILIITINYMKNMKKYKTCK